MRGIIVIAIKDVQEIDFEQIPEDAFWNIGNAHELKMHRIHAYPAKFPAFITTKALEYAKRKKIKVDIMADIFCGCGTVAYEAKRNGINFWGCDINPVATLIAKAKSQKYNEKRLDEYYYAIKDDYEKQNLENEYYNASERLKYWYFEKQYNELTMLKKVIEKNIRGNEKYRMFFLCAFSNILKCTSKWLTKSIKPQVDPEKKIIDVWRAFEAQYKFMFHANHESGDLLDVETTIINANLLDESFEKPKVDLIVTSPPYVTSYEYADLHQLSSLWLEYAEDYRELREGTIGSLHHSSDFSETVKSLNKSGFNVVDQLLSQDKLKAKSVAKYFLDMQNVAETSYEMLNADGLVVFVIGDTEYKKVRIENTRHLIESLQTSGFRKIEITKRKISRKILTPYRDERGKFTTNSNSRKVYSEEFIVMGRK